MTNKRLGFGYLAKNEHKKAENHPDWKGRLTVGETKYDIAGYEAINDEGKTFVKISLTEPYVKVVKPAPEVKAFEDEVPF